MKYSSVVVICLLVISVHPAFAGLKLGFSGGGSSENPVTTAVDAYPGMAGKGWQGAWAVVNRPTRASLSLEVLDLPPFSPNSGHYLQMKYEDLDGDVSATSGVVRAFSSDPAKDGVDPAKPYQVRFQVRMDSVSEDFSTSGDLWMFYGSKSEKNERSGEDAELPAWVLMYRPDLGWMARVGSQGTPRRIGRKDVRVGVGVIWTITISVQPATSQYNVEIASSEGENFQGSGFGSGLAPSSEPPVFLNFLLSRKGTGKTAVWSLNNIEVIQDHSRKDS